MAGDSTVSTDGDDAAGGDPRLSTEYVRRIELCNLDGSRERSGNVSEPSGDLSEDSDDAPGDSDDARGDPDGECADRGAITLVGVVHDHPSSVYRVQRVAAERDPTVLALELPPMAVPLFERYARDESTPPETGGEMSAAIQAAETERTAGIDGPTPGFAVRLGRHLLAERSSVSTVRTAFGRFARASGHAVACRAASVLAAVTDRKPELSAPREHAVAEADPPIEQARDERKQVRLARSVAAAFGADRSVATRDETREAHMAARLASLAESGDVVAVLGIDHVESVAERLAEGSVDAA